MQAKYKALVTKPPEFLLRSGACIFMAPKMKNGDDYDANRAQIWASVGIGCRVSCEGKGRHGCGEFRRQLMEGWPTRTRRVRTSARRGASLPTGNKVSSHVSTCCDMIR